MNGVFRAALLRTTPGVVAADVAEARNVTYLMPRLPRRGASEAQLESETASLAPQAAANAQAQAQAQAQAPPPPSPPPYGKRKLLFIGDSLVTGVGCSPERGLGPALPL